MKPGKVWIAGAGSDAGLITAAALEAVRGADVIVYDELMDHSVLAEAKEGCELIPAGKRKNAHRLEQEEIGQLLTDLAKSGKKVVRLKGGDPTVFGRGGEEALRLEAEGIPYELIPGVSSCIAAPEHMGISITQRGIASSFSVVTGHCDPETAEDFSVLAKLKGTILYLMGLSRADEIAAGLIGAGKDPETPVSILSCVYTEEEKRLDGRLRELGKIARSAKAPAVIVIGPVAELRLKAEKNGISPKRETAGTKRADFRGGTGPGSRSSQKTVLAVGTQSFTQRMAEALRKEDFAALPFPCIGIEPAGERIPESFSGYDWMVFTSANGVRVFMEEMERRRTDLRSLGNLRIACIGRGTSKELEKARIYPDLIPEKYTTEALSEAIARAVKPGERVLILRAAEGNPMLTNRLKNEKILYDDRWIYSTKYTEPLSRRGERSFDPGEADYIVFASAGGVRAFLEANAYPENAVPVCIGELTAAELRRITGRRAVTAAECSVEGILSALCKAQGADIR